MADLAAAGARRAAAPSQRLAARWRESGAYRALNAQFDDVAADAEAVTKRARALLADDGWVAPLLAPLIAAQRGDPWIEPPFKVNREAGKIGAVLYDGPTASVTASVISADWLAAMPRPMALLVPGRLTVVRYIRAGGAKLQLWRADSVDAQFTAAGAAPAMPIGVLTLRDGMVLRLDGRSRGWWLEAGGSDVVTLTAVVKLGAAPLMREYALPRGGFLRCATLDDGAARAQMLLTLLRVTRRADAGDRFAAASHDPAPFLRWSAMREWLALDARAALPRLAAMAEADPNEEVRGAATTTLTMVERNLAARSCQG
ncbi:MAG: hypothetical protein ACTHMG_09455 [Sphingomonas sp.]